MTEERLSEYEGMSKEIFCQELRQFVTSRLALQEKFLKSSVKRRKVAFQKLISA